MEVWQKSSPALDLPCKIVARSGTRKLDFTVQGSIAEEVTEVLKELQKLIRCILKHCDHLCCYHVVHHKEGGLQKKRGSHGTPMLRNCPLDLKSTPHNNPFRDPSLGIREGRKEHGSRASRNGDSGIGSIS